ncbi:LRR receptor-like serine/threonine-protein kinase [Dorcoceras hygrometricum]|nr:LRR receptor-like serine/threonine-protein kinase [Dorcoceras hygrometricum]
MAMASSLFVLAFLVVQSNAQQAYVNNKQLACENNDTVTLGYVCNGVAAYCTSYLTFRSTPVYNNPATIAYLLAADASQIAAVNNISDVAPIPDDTLLVIPVNCSCAGGNYYQHNASYVLKHTGETYLSIANNTYQALTTCQSMIAQNSINERRLLGNDRLTVPVRCACPTPNQTAAGFSYLLTYLVRQGNDIPTIADTFSGAGADQQSIREANKLSDGQIIFYFTPILVPLRREPTKENLNTDILLPPPPPPPTSATPTSENSGNSRKWVFVGVGVGVAAVLLLAFVLLFWFFRRRSRRHEQSAPPPPKLANESGERFWSVSLSSEGIRSAMETLKIYKFEELEKATNSFAEANRIGKSSVYRGSFKGDAAAVKIMKGDVSPEIDLLRQINHFNIIRLSGFCLHEGVTYLVYEYAVNGSLSNWLQRKDDFFDENYNSSNDKLYSKLDWKHRAQIAYDAADALNYLHNFTNPQYIHKNLNSSNILLDGNMRAKITNFGFAKKLDDTGDQPVMTRHVVGTYGYMAPEYLENGLITPKLDVFALGVVILELLSGREPVANASSEKGDQILLSESIREVLSGENVREKLGEFIDPRLGEEYPLDLAYSMAQLAKNCVANDLNDRPTVPQMLMVLSKILSSSLDWDPSHEFYSSSLSTREL